MAAASLVATAFGIIVIIVTAYVLAGSTLVTSEVVSTAQKDMTEIQLKMLGTSVQYVDSSLSPGTVYIELGNNGREPIRDYRYMDVFVSDEISREWFRFPYSDYPQVGSWSIEEIRDNLIYPNQWDPGETINISVRYAGISPSYFKIVTPNGVALSHEI
ncbi:MAG: hypothetical protein QFX32_03545 [Methanolinea sp.]|nr:hypothetical protein [Methanolinea sp.]